MLLFQRDIIVIECSILQYFLSLDFVVRFWENQKGKLEIFVKDCCSATFDAAALAQCGGELYLLAASFKILKSGKHTKVSFCILFSKQSP